MLFSEGFHPHVSPGHCPPCMTAALAPPQGNFVACMTAILRQMEDYHYAHLIKTFGKMRTDVVVSGLFSPSPWAGTTDPAGGWGPCDRVIGAESQAMWKGQRIRTPWEAGPGQLLTLRGLLRGRPQEAPSCLFPAVSRHLDHGSWGWSTRTPIHFPTH